MGVSSPLERKKAIKNTAKNAPMDIKDFFNFALSLARFLSEKNNVVATVRPKMT